MTLTHFRGRTERRPRSGSTVGLAPPPSCGASKPLGSLSRLRASQHRRVQGGAQGATDASFRVKSTGESSKKLEAAPVPQRAHKRRVSPLSHIRTEMRARKVHSMRLRVGRRLRRVRVDRKVSSLLFLRHDTVMADRQHTEEGKSRKVRCNAPIQRSLVKRPIRAEGCQERMQLRLGRFRSGVRFAAHIRESSVSVW